MAKRTTKPHYIREWREYRGLSLRKLSTMLPPGDNDKPMSAASLSRIETGKQPYSQPIMEALARALSTDVPSLIGRPPQTPPDLLLLYERLSERDRSAVMRVLDGFMREYRGLDRAD
jgi:transcriptional regulator with XRE-family HTH domain